MHSILVVEVNIRPDHALKLTIVNHDGADREVPVRTADSALCEPFLAQQAKGLASLLPPKPVFARELP